MSPRSRAVLPGLLLAALLPSCLTPGPRIPFDTGRGWLATVIASERSTDDRYIHRYNPIGIEVFNLMPGTAGWGWELSARYGSDTGEDKERKQVKAQFPADGTHAAHNQPTNVSVSTERESQVLELSMGVRQVYGPDWRVQPYLGVGGSYFRIENDDDLSGTYVIPDLSHAGVPDFVYTPGDEQSKENSWGLYMRAGLNWRVTGEPDGSRLSLFLSSDVRALVGYEFDYIEWNVGLGIGR